ncbi:hypothetical protein CLV62_12713 [Dysgonomonas alginatilytica]|uniref:Trimeric autotransporter adhesin n=1 Tax=Dysgonomonas alginatilytica TaxID=1605892 RepID=A0A2V3PJT9_9BACT|nr:hypothetical protein [Dysgonomonas alginatilytica]PXV61014.1 hypothetical protein CLV62_12713 [Dysgonomonas alginatilytica]
MKTKLFFIFLLLMSALTTNAQVGINTESPKATLDVNPSNADGVVPEGIIAPKLSLKQLADKDSQYTTNQTGAIVYVSDISGTTTAKTTNIKKVGYYYFDGTLWQAFAQTSAAGWNLTGNTGTDPLANFLGTTDNKDLLFKRNNVLAGYLGSSGYNGETNNTVFGVGALSTSATTPGWNVAIGNNSLRANTTGGNNTAIGHSSLVANDKGGDNTAIGFSSQSANVSGTYNISVGSATLNSNVIGGSNTAVGAHSLSKSTGSFNTAVGNNSIANLTSGESNIGIGYLSGSGLTTGSNNIAIGKNTSLPATSSNQMNIGNLLFGTGMSGTLAAPAGRVGIGTSVPASTLHINGDLTIGTANTASADVSMLVRNNTSGLVGVIPQTNIPFNPVASGATVTMDVGALFYPGAGHIIVTSNNTCNRFMTAIFSVVVSHPTDFGLSIVYLNGMAREVVGVATKVSSFKYQVKFPNVTTCADGGNGTQFDFTIDTSVPGKISITNNGNITRSYSVRISQII